MKIDFKIITWESLDVETKHGAVILEKIKNGELETSNDVIEFIAELDNDSSTSCEVDLYSTQMTLKENNGRSTIVIYTKDCDNIEYENGN